MLLLLLLLKHFSLAGFENLPFLVSLAAWCRINEGFGFGIMDCGRRRSSNGVGEDGIEMRQEDVAAEVDVEKGVKGFNVESFLNPSFHPIMLPA